MGRMALWRHIATANTFLPISPARTCLPGAWTLPITIPRATARASSVLPAPICPRSRAAFYNVLLYSFDVAALRMVDEAEAQDVVVRWQGQFLVAFYDVLSIGLHGL